MKNKVLVELVVPTIESSFDVYLPINKRIGNIITLLNKTVSEFSEGCYEGSNQTSLYNRETSEKYDANTLLYNTDIRNGTTLILL